MRIPRRFLGLMLGAALVPVGVPAMASAAPSSNGTPGPNPTSLSCTGDPSSVLPLNLTVDGQDSPGLYVLPASAPKGLVVFFHGYTKTDQAWEKQMIQVATQDGAIAVAMNYRGTIETDVENGVQRSVGMPLAAGTDDGVAAAKAFDAACPGLPKIVAYGNSQGGGIADLAVAKDQKRADGKPLFDRLITTAGFSNLIEGWAELNAAAATGQTFFVQGLKDLQAETGGTPLTAPAAYQELSPVLRASDIAKSGVTSVTLLHGLADGTVPVDQSVEMALALTAAGVPVDLKLAGGNPTWAGASGDTLDGFALGLLGFKNWNSPLVGHPHDEDPTHALTIAGLKELARLMRAGQPAPTCLKVDFIDPAVTLADAAPVCSLVNQVKALIDPTPVITLVTKTVAPVLSLLTGGLGGLLRR